MRRSTSAAIRHASNVRRAFCSTSSPITLEPKPDNVLKLTMDDGKMNAFSYDFIKLFHSRLDDATDAGALVITGNRKAFSAGFDLSVLGKGFTPEGAELVRQGAELMFRIAAFPRPVVMAVPGHALALGAIMLFTGDVRIAADNAKAKVGMNEVRIGMPLPIFAMELGRWRLAKQEFTRATTLGTVFDVHAAAGAGYLDSVVPADELANRALAAATDVASIATAPFARTKMIERNAVLERCKLGLAHDVELFAKGP